MSKYISGHSALAQSPFDEEFVNFGFDPVLNQHLNIWPMSIVTAGIEIYDNSVSGIKVFYANRLLCARATILVV